MFVVHFVDVGLLDESLRGDVGRIFGTGIEDFVDAWYLILNPLKVRPRGLKRPLVYLENKQKI